jgi:hypothetical protein
MRQQRPELAQQRPDVGQKRPEMGQQRPDVGLILTAQGHQLPCQEIKKEKNRTRKLKIKTMKKAQR